MLDIIIAPQKVKNIWMLTFEYDGIASLGGLGRAVALYVKALIKKGYSVTVFMPSHGRHLSPEHRSRLNLKNVDDFGFCSYRLGVDGNRYWYCLGAEVGGIDGAKLVLFKGLDIPTGKIIDSWYIYSWAEEKASLFSRALLHWVEHYNDVPDLVHANDWTSGIAGSMLKIFFELKGYSIPFVYSIHLLSWKSFPWHYASSEWSGMPNILHRVWRYSGHELDYPRVIWDSVKGNIDNFVALESDVLASNSWNYINEILNYFGRWMEPKTFVIHNATEWNVEEVRNIAHRYIGESRRDIVRMKLLREYINTLPYRKIGKIGTCRFLVTVAGRITAAKGLDIAIKILDYMSNDICLAVLGIPIGDTGYEDYLIRLANERYGRIVLFLEPIPQELLKLFIYASNAFIVPSRYEPFGMVSIESQALGTPVVVANSGGLPETVIDIRGDRYRGTGAVVAINDLYGYGETVEDIAILTEYIDTKDSSILIRIRSSWARELLKINPGIDIRGNCISWINSKFRLNNIAELLASCYEKARIFAYYRALTPP